MDRPCRFLTRAANRRPHSRQLMSAPLQIGPNPRSLLLQSGSPLHLDLAPPQIPPVQQTSITTLSISILILTCLLCY